jgi:hypothetical protein
MYVETRLAHYEYQPATKLISTASAMLLYIRRNTGASSALTRRPIRLPIPIHPSASAPVRPRPRKLCTHPRCNSRANRLCDYQKCRTHCVASGDCLCPSHGQFEESTSTQEQRLRTEHPDWFISPTPSPTLPSVPSSRLPASLPRVVPSFSYIPSPAASQAVAVLIIILLFYLELDCIDLLVAL